jgi:hypothetical protein
MTPKKAGEPAKPSVKVPAVAGPKLGPPATASKPGPTKAVTASKPGVPAAPSTGPQTGSTKAVPAPTDSYVGKAKGNPLIGDIPTGSHHIQGSGSTQMTAPEVSQGRWRDRVVAPRMVMTKDEMLGSLESTLRVVLGDANHVRVAYDQLRRGWLPTIRQALEQAGGDGLDAWLTVTLRGPGRSAMDPLFDSLVADLLRLRAAKDLASFEEEAHKAIGTVQRVLSFEAPRKLSFKVLEKELEGKLEVDELFLIAVSDEGELTRRLKEIGGTMENLREQIRKTPGKQPTGIFSNFVRLKAEVRVLDAELKRRGVQAG